VRDPKWSRRWVSMVACRLGGIGIGEIFQSVVDSVNGLNLSAHIRRHAGHLDAHRSS